MSNWTAASSDCGRPLNDDVHIKTADLYRPNARFTPERQRYQALTPFGKLGYSHLMDAVAGDLASVTADTAYDTVATYDAAGARSATVVVSPTKTAKVSWRRPRSSARDRTIKKVKALGRRQWKKVSGYHQQARAENAFFRYKSIIGGGLRARTPGGREAEALLACNVLNRMTELGRSQSYSIGP